MCVQQLLFVHSGRFLRQNLTYESMRKLKIMYFHHSGAPPHLGWLFILDGYEVFFLTILHVLHSAVSSQ